MERGDAVKDAFIQPAHEEDLNNDTNDANEKKEMKELHDDGDNDSDNEQSVEVDSENSFIVDSDDESHSTPETSDSLNVEAPLSDAEIEDLLSELLEVEIKAAEAQESLEAESLQKIEAEVRAELTVNLEGDELENAISTEMKTYIEQWELTLDDLETQSAVLLEQLDAAGIELPRLYKFIESQVSKACQTEAWRKRTHWVGSQLTPDVSESVANAEKCLQSHRPVRRQHGRLLEEGASGFLAKKLPNVENSGRDWSTFNEFVKSSNKSSSSVLFGSKDWAAVYMASTPRQAVELGLMLPGVNEVEEINDIQTDSSDPFVADAITNEKDIDLSEEQKKNFRKVREEDDACLTRELQNRLKCRRRKRRLRQDSFQKNEGLNANSGFLLSEEGNLPRRNSVNLLESNGSSSASHKCHSGKKTMRDGRLSPRSDDFLSNSRRYQTVILESDDELQMFENMPLNASGLPKIEGHSRQANRAAEIIDVDVHSSPSPKASLQSKEAVKKFNCTVCFKLLQISRVQRHPLLGVILCEYCRPILEERLSKKDLDPNGCFCTWCGRLAELVKCSSCSMMFCLTCIKRNLGETQLIASKASGWRCCCCSPILLQSLISLCDRALISVTASSSSSDMEHSDSDNLVPIRNRRRKKKIRRILDDTELGVETKQKIEMEKARREHLKSMQLLRSSCSNQESVTEDTSTEVLGDIKDGFVVNVAREEDEELVKIPPSISSKLKPHQIEGIRFMWENIIQSFRKVKSGDKGLGCILAHTMGLGKTFQVITFLYIVLRSVDLGLKTALIVTPVNVLHNWKLEFMKWRPVELKTLRIFMLEDVAREKRAWLLSKWRSKGGVFLIGYASFRNLALGKNVKDLHLATEMRHALQYGPDILVCDEAHIIKNTRADVTQALKQVKSQRRIALTGSPLQNNLMEYYCMVDFVREGFLGSSHEFRNRFQNPIENGQHANSTSDDVKIMNQRSHILYKQLKGFVQRMDMNVVKRDLPPKTVYVISVRLSALQRKLYKRFLDVHGFSSGKISDENFRRKSCFFSGYQALAQICNHPGLLQMAKEHKEHLIAEDIVEGFLSDDGTSDEDSGYNGTFNEDAQHLRKDSICRKSNGTSFLEEKNWWGDIFPEKIYKEADYSGKIVLLLDILSLSSNIGDKSLVFSHSLATLDLIELFLSKLTRKSGQEKFWKRGKDWYRLDGSTESSERQKIVERFNDIKNKRVKCTLVSTRAGSLGINLYGANRVVIFDGSWNPTYDLQAIYRAWRYGQIKPVYAYRLMAHGTMEEKIYKRQVTKEGLAARVIDRQQIHRTMSKEEILHLFDFGDDENTDTVVGQLEMGILQTHQQQKSEYACLLKKKSSSFSTEFGSSDTVMETLKNRHHPEWIQDYHEHERLLQENEDERLTKEEQDVAWQTFVQTLEWEEVQRVSLDEQVKKVFGSEFLDCEPKTSKNQMSLQKNNQHIILEEERNRPVPERKCSNLSHLLTLRSQGTKSGSTTICKECSQEISWENLNRDGKLK